jgi:hypothetical protein
MDEVAEVDVSAALAAGLMVFEVMGREGDVKRTWDPNNLSDIIAAKAEFEKMRASGMRAYRLNPDGSQGSPMPTFEMSAGRVLFVPQMVGG